MSTPEVKILSEEEIDKRRERRQHRLDQYFIPNRANTMVHYAEGLYRDLIKETEEAEATIRELQKQLADEQAENKDLWDTLDAVKKNDASPGYDYHGKRSVRPFDGAKPAAGQRWNTPREIVDNALRAKVARLLNMETNGNTEGGER